MKNVAVTPPKVLRPPSPVSQTCSDMSQRDGVHDSDSFSLGFQYLSGFQLEFQEDL